MSKAITQPRDGLSKYAPQITTITVPVDKIREVIGSGGKVVKDIIAKTGCKIDINDDGKINIASADGAAAQRAIDMIKAIVMSAEEGKVYKGIVKKIVEFGAFVGILPNQDGLLHISEIAHERVNVVTDYLKEGDEIEVKVLEIDRAGKVRLSRKALLPPPAGGAAPREGGGGGDRGPRGGGGGGDRGPRGGGGGGRPQGPRN
jgi:polyribonucleotide nucleotidyltransferase